MTLDVSACGIKLPMARNPILFIFFNLLPFTLYLSSLIVSLKGSRIYFLNSGVRSEKLVDFVFHSIFFKTITRYLLLLLKVGRCWFFWGLFGRALSVGVD